MTTEVDLSRDLSRFHYENTVPKVRVLASRFKPGLSEEFMSSVHGAFGSNRYAEVMDVSGIEHLVELAPDGVGLEPEWMSAEEWRKLVGIPLK